MAPAEIMQLPQEQVMRPGMPGALAQKIRWWLERKFTRKQQLPPPVIPNLGVVVAWMMARRWPNGSK